jgi:protein-disulfide isomerase
VAAAAGSALAGRARAEEAAPDTSKVIEMTLGAEDAPVTVVEYAMFTCPHCASFHAGPFRELKANYIDTGKVRFIYREVYFNRPSLWAGMVARCAGPERYFAMVDLLFEKQVQWAGAGDPSAIAANLRTLGKTAGLSDAQLDACMTDADTAQALFAVYEENAKRDGVEATPTFLIDGEKYSNMSYDDFAAILDAKLGQ